MTVSAQNKINYLLRAIAGWYDSAKIDYGVVGKVLSIVYFTQYDTITVIVEEEGKYFQCDLIYSGNYSAEQLYSIWMEDGTAE